MEKLIAVYNNSIPNTLCDELIELFDNEKNKYHGLTLGGLRKDYKDTTDFPIPKEDEKWSNIINFLNKELTNKLGKYIESNTKNKYTNNYGVKFCLFENELSIDSFIMKKYDRQQGKYVYHNDFDIKTNTNSYRLLTFLWYINTVEEGGETVFLDDFEIKPEKGKLVLFPSFWCFPHTGKMPISSNKYIITGWIYSN